MTKFVFEEFFAGGGMVRQGLGPDWGCSLANDFDGKKALAYQENWGTGGELFVGDIRDLPTTHLANGVNLSWASFPCQDLSLAGQGNGLRGKRSSMFYVFWEKMLARCADNNRPEIVVIENVTGALTSNGGEDFVEIVKTFKQAGYQPGGVVIDASLFVPQSRKRLFVVGIREDLDIDPILVNCQPTLPYHSNSLVRSVKGLPKELRDSWLWFNLPLPNWRNTALIDLLECPHASLWDADLKTQKILDRMSPLNLRKVELAQKANGQRAGTFFNRTRKVDGKRRVVVEVRFDEIAGCLRTPNGGSSRQGLIWVHEGKVKTRLLSPRETARLMGLPENYKLPRNRNAALHLTGDGVVSPVVTHLKDHLFEPILGCWGHDAQRISVAEYKA